MSMNVGSSDGSGDDPEPMMDINTTPLIDVMLVLLIMLIITIPIQLHQVSLDMPTGQPPPKLVEPEVVKLDINERGVTLAFEFQERVARAEGDDSFSADCERFLGTHLVGTSVGSNLRTSSPCSAWS